MQQSDSQARPYTGPERRAFPRYGADVFVREVVPGSQVYQTVSLGCGGMAMFVEQSYTPGTMVVMEIDPEDGSVPFTAPAKVVRVDHGHKRPLMVLKFLMPQTQLKPFLEKTEPKLS